MYRRSIGKQHGKCWRIVASRTLARSCSNVPASPRAHCSNGATPTGKRGADVRRNGKKSPRQAVPRKNRAASVVAILPRQAGAGHTVAPPNVPSVFFTLAHRGRAKHERRDVLRRKFAQRPAASLCVFLLRAAPPDKAYRERHCPLPAAEKG